MTNEEFFNLRVGDEICINTNRLYCGAKIIEARTNGLNNDITYIKVKENNSENIHTILRELGFWYFDGVSIEYVNKGIKFITIIKKKEDMIQDKITEAKNEISRLEKLVKTLEDEKKSKELKEQISKLIPGNFYTVKTNNGNFTGELKYMFSDGSLMFNHPKTGSYTVNPKYRPKILEIIDHPAFTNEFNNLMKKLETFNKEI